MLMTTWPASGAKDVPKEVPAEPGFELRALGRGRNEIQVWGKFPPGWLGGFTAGLAREQINVVRGEAKKVSAAIWHATFEVEAGRGDGRLGGIDFLALTAERADPGTVPAIRLESFRLEREEGALLVEIHGADRLGFLVAMLRCFAFYALFPAEMTVETAAGQVYDTFRLKGVGGMTPSAAALQALRDDLQGMVGP